MEIPKIRMPNFESPVIDFDTPAMREIGKSNQREHNRKVFGFWWNIVSTLIIIVLAWFNFRLSSQANEQASTIEILQEQIDEQSNLIHSQQRQIDDLIIITTELDTIQ